MTSPGSAQVTRRSASAVEMRQLPHRTVQMLTTPEDGSGPLSVVIARFAPGLAQGHVHWPGGEALYVVSGKGRLRVEGLPFPLEPGIGAFTPPCIEHHVENDLNSDMVLVGAFCPAAIPGSYPDRPPRLKPSGKLASVDHMYRRADPGARVALGRPSMQAVVEDRSLSPHTSLRLVRLASRDTMFRDGVPFTRAWLVLEGTADLLSPDNLGGPLRAWDVVVAPPGTGLKAKARDTVLAILEIDAHLDPEHLRGEPC
jgi:quercetin dioxygenase-like cupin family protein